jgi:hypothetical protein
LFIDLELDFGFIRQVIVSSYDKIGNRTSQIRIYSSNILSSCVIFVRLFF